MARPSGFTPEQKREHVLAHLRQPHGMKGRYIQQVGITAVTLRKWRSQMAAGTLETGLVPRKLTRELGLEENKELVRMADEAAKHRAEIDQLKATHAKELAEKDAQIAKAEKVADALGKAIALVQRDDEQNTGTDQDSPKTNSSNASSS